MADKVDSSNFSESRILSVILAKKEQQSQLIKDHKQNEEAFEPVAKEKPSDDQSWKKKTKPDNSESGFKSWSEKRMSTFNKGKIILSSPVIPYKKKQGNLQTLPIDITEKKD